VTREKMHTDNDDI